MTRDDVRDNWDEIVTDRRLTLELANRHLAQVRTSGPAYLRDQYHVVASSGSTGQRTVFAVDFSSWLEAGCRSRDIRLELRDCLDLKGSVEWRSSPPNAIHESGALFQQPYL